MESYRLAGQRPRAAEHRRAAGHSLRPANGSSRTILPAEIRQVTVRTPGGQAASHTWEEFKQLKQQIRDSAVQQLERRFLVEALQRCSGNVRRAAEEIGIQRTNLHALMRKHGLSSDI